MFKENSCLTCFFDNNKMVAPPVGIGIVVLFLQCHPPGENKKLLFPL